MRFGEPVTQKTDWWDQRKGSGEHKKKVAFALCAAAFPREFFTDNNLVIANGAIAHVAEDALWCEACSVQVAKTKEDVLAHVGSGKHKKKVALVGSRAGSRRKPLWRTNLASPKAATQMWPGAHPWGRASGVRVAMPKRVVLAPVGPGGQKAVPGGRARFRARAPSEDG